MAATAEPMKVVSGLDEVKLPVDLAGDDFVSNKYAYYKWMRDEAPVCPIKISVLRGNAVSRYEDCAQLAKDARFVRNRSNATGGGRFPIPLPRSLRLVAESMIVEDDPEHRRLRGLVNQAFKPAAIGRLEKQIEELTHQLLDAAEKQGEVDLMEAYALPIPVTVIQRLLGISDADMPKFRNTLGYLIDGFSGWRVLRTAFWELPAAVRFMREMIEEKRSNPQDDILTELIQAEEEGDRLNEDELVAMCFLLVIAGYETTSHLITNAILTLLQHPDQLERLRAEPALMASAVEEVQRFRGPVQSSKPCYATEEVMWHGVRIKKGGIVMPMYGAANHDPEAFEAPETFDIARDPNHHFGFGHGLHFCLGAQLARLETRIAVSNLLARNPNLRLAVQPEKLRLQNLPGWHRYASLPVVLGSS